MVIIQERYHFKYLPSLFKSEKSSITEAQKRYKNRSVYFIVGIIFKRVSHKTKRLANYCPNGDRECVTFSYCQTKHSRHGFCWNEARIHTRHPPNCRTCSFTFTPNRNTISACLTLFQSHTGWLKLFSEMILSCIYISKWELIQSSAKEAKCLIIIHNVLFS